MIPNMNVPHILTLQGLLPYSDGRLIIYESIPFVERPKWVFLGRAHREYLRRQESSPCIVMTIPDVDELSFHLPPATYVVRVRTQIFCEQWHSGYSSLSRPVTAEYPVELQSDYDLVIAHQEAAEV